jgi:hypothetical protein
MFLVVLIIQKKIMMLSRSILAIVEIDKEIGIVAVRESNGNRSYNRVYWTRVQ